MGIEQAEKTHTKRRLNPLDAGIVVVILLALGGFALAKKGYAGVNSAIAENGAVDIDVSFTGVKTLDLNLFKVGEPSSMTIRNVPVEPPMKIINVVHWPKQVSFLSPDGKRAVSMNDPANPIAHDFLVTVQEDHADRTKDGWVIRGNKIKVGNPIELESEKYRISGVVADIHRPNDAANASAVKQLEQDTNKQPKTSK